jgi:FAD/FMN-containing dehydrogenase
MPNSALLDALATFLPDRLLRQAAELAPYESDALTAFRSRLAVSPETQDEVVRRCSFVARGSGTSLSGGSLPVAGGVVIALNRLNRIVRLDPAAAHCCGGAGRDQPGCDAKPLHLTASTMRPTRPAS